MAYRLHDDRVLIDLTGIVLLGLQGGSNWVRKTLQAEIYGGKATPLLHLEAAADGFHWEVRPEMWSVSAAPASMFNSNTAVNAGWAVDTCNTEWDLGNPASSGNLLGYINLYLNLAVRDSDGILYRISYDFRAVGQLLQVKDHIVE
jgi:hypothetical protein